MTTPDRAAAAAALMTALREVADASERLTAANERLQLATAWTLEAFGDHLDAETVRMLPVRGGPARLGRPAVPGTARDEDVTDQPTLLIPITSVTGDELPDETGTMRHGIGMPEWMAKLVDRDRGDDQ